MTLGNTSMPAAPRAKRRTSISHRHELSQKETPSRSRPQSLYEPTSVQDRVRQWQAGAAGDAASPDALSVRSTPLSDTASEVSRARTPEKRAPVPPPTWRQRFVGKERELRAEEKATREITAPRKRVISDEHWKSRRQGQAESPPMAAARQGVRTPHHDLSYTSTNPQSDREARRAVRRRARKSRDNLNPEPPVVQDLNDYIDHELAQHLDTPEYGEDRSDRGSMPSSLPDEEHDAPMPGSKYADSLGRPDAPAEHGVYHKPRPQGGRILSKTRQMLKKADDPPPLSNRVPSIEAWLEEQPDPFTDADRDSPTPAVEAPEPLRKRSRRANRKTSDLTAVDTNRIWDAVTVHEDGQEPGPYSGPSAGADHSIDRADRRKRGSVRETLSPEASPTGLKRRGARTQRKPQPPEHRSPSSRTTPTEMLPLRPSRKHEERPGPPTSGQRLETIASVETFKQNEEPPAYEELLSKEECGLKRKLTTHEDLMSVLSIPMNRKSTRSRRRPKPSSAWSAAEVLQSLLAEEERYARELKTLVDGVIPVLLQCVLSKSNSVAAACLFTTSPNGKDDTAISKPIIDMGIALERLKSMHGRIPLQNVDSLLAWGHSAQKTYNDYLNAWRLGFHDVVINLAPLKEGEDNVDAGMSRDADGDVVNAEGKKVDVAYLLKRPLVRVKTLSKTFTCIQEQTGKSLAVDVAKIFSELTATARRRNQEEQARLEDEAAAGIDLTRTRNIRNLGSNADVALDKTRKVRARDCFNLTVYHSTGQRIDCRAELVYRDNAPGQPPGGDVLICEIDESGKWLLFAPVSLFSISARKGEDDFDLVVMIRGPSGIGQEWQELLALKSDDPEATAEWLSMLGSYPLPPKLNRTRSFKDAQQGAMTQPFGKFNTDQHADPPKIEEVNILPLGEPSIVGRSNRSSPRIKLSKPLFEKLIPRLNLGGGLQPQQSPPIRPVNKRPSSPKTFAASTYSSDRSTISDSSLRELPTIPKASSAPATPGKATPRRSLKEDNLSSQHVQQFMMSGALPVPGPDVEDKVRDSQSISQASTPKAAKDVTKASMNKASPKANQSSERPAYNRAVSSTPSQNFPTIARLRSLSTSKESQTSTPLNEFIRDQWNTLSGSGNSAERRWHRTKKPRSEIFTEDVPSPPVLTPHRESSSPSTLVRPAQSDLVSAPPPPPPHRDTTGISSGQGKAQAPEPQLKPSRKHERAKKRRSSSPLKKEYAPSTASESSSGSDSEDMSDSSSETSQDFMSEVQDVHTPLVAVTGGNRRSSKMAQQRPVSVPTTGTRTLVPSDSASQGPYRKVPSSSALANGETHRKIALVCTWSDKGSWEQIYPDECSIVISPGLIEAFEMSAAHSGPGEARRDQVSDACDSRTSSVSEQPLVAFELTPIVPLRRGTALDINIRSPPTASSKLKTTSNIMFRSRNPDECDTLYGMINWARCHNPTYIQLQNARPRQPAVTFDLGQAEPTRPRSGSWFGFRGNEKQSSYRAASAPGGMSIGGESDASTGTMNTAMSALKRFGANSAFNLNRSSVLRKPGTSRASGSLYSSDSGTRTGSGSSTPIASQLGFIPGKDGPNVPSTSAEAVGGAGMINNMKIRLYARKGQGWENLGASRLSVLPAADATPRLEETFDGNSGQSTPPRQPSTGTVGQPGTKGPRLHSSNFTPHRIHGNGREKRVVIRKNKSGDVVLLDAVLGESCFERVMQTGIAVKVWSEDEEIADRGGVVMGRERIYMMQFPGAREAGWVFGLCGTYRYGGD